MHIDLRRPSPERQQRDRGPRYGSDAAVRTRLLMLVGMLIFLFFLIGEARKPENYHWLTKLQGGKAPASSAKAAPRPALVDPETGTKWIDITDSLPNRPATAESSASRPPNSKANAAAGNQEPLAAGQELAAGPPAAEPANQPRPEAATGPWSILLGELNNDERVALFRLLRISKSSSDFQGSSVLNENPAATALLGNSALLKKLQRRINELYTAQLDRGGSGGSNEERSEQLAAIVEFKSQWDAALQPAFQALSEGQTLTPPQANQIEVAREQIFRQALSSIQDATEVTRPDDSLAWLLAWQQLLGSPLGRTTAVTPYELLTQPKQFRGRAVSFSGTLRGIETATANEQELGLAQYYVLWIQPKELERTPYCVYTAELPPELRPTGDRFELTRQPLTVRGLFWKIRTYVDTTRAVATCPLVLARNIVIAAPAVTAEPYRWKPPAWLLWAISLLLPVVACAIAWRIYQTGREFTLPSSPGRRRMILDSLEELGADQSIQSARESLARLEAAPEQSREEQ